MREYLDFLGSQPPFDSLDPPDLERLAQLVEVEYFPVGTEIVTANSEALNHFYVVRSGEVEVIDRGEVVDVLLAGETFGHISVLSGSPPPLSIRASEDTLCYRMADPRTELSHPERLRFSHYAAAVSQGTVARLAMPDPAMRVAAQQMRPPVWCPADATVEEAAAAITKAGQSCALIPLGGDLGVITDSDFRAALSEPTIGRHSPAREIASSPAAAVSVDTPVSDALLRMVECGHHHLIVTDASHRPVGILRVADVASAEVRDPLVIRRAIDDASSIEGLSAAAAMVPDTWHELFTSGAAAMQIAALMSAVIDAIVRRTVELTDIAGDWVPNRMSWLLMGSVARREPLPWSDVDTAVIWEDLDDQPSPDANARRWAGRVLHNLELCGLARCAQGANATNPQFAQSKAQAAATATSWLTDPNQKNALLLSSMIADSRPLTNVPLGRAVVEAMLASTRSHEYLALLLRFATSVRPPIGFARGLVVEHSGMNRGQLNLKAGGLRPIAALGHWIAIVTGDDRGSTISRLRRGNAAGLLTDDETESLTQAFGYIYGLLLDRELTAEPTADRTAAAWIDPKELNTLTRRYLKEVFRAVSHVQSRLAGEWVARLP